MSDLTARLAQLQAIVMSLARENAALRARLESATVAEGNALAVLAALAK